MSFESDFKWQQKLLPEVIQHCGTHLAHRVIGEAPMEEDRHHNTDLMVLNWDQVRIGVRLRTISYYHDTVYRNQFTIRLSRRFGETEWKKMLNGFGDYFVYGFANIDRRGNPVKCGCGSLRPHLVAWFIGDLNVLRRWRGAYLEKHGVEPGIVKPNRDGSSDFVAFKVNELPESFIIHREHGACFNPQPLNMNFEVDPDYVENILRDAHRMRRDMPQEHIELLAKTLTEEWPDNWLSV